MNENDKTIEPVSNPTYSKSDLPPLPEDEPTVEITKETEIEPEKPVESPKIEVLEPLKQEIKLEKPKATEEKPQPKNEPKKAKKPFKLPKISVPFLPTIIIALIIIVMILTYSLIQLNEQLREANAKIKDENSGLVTEKDKLIAELESLVNDNDELEKIINELKGQVDAPEECSTQKMNIGVASYEIPCKWNGFFELGYSTQAESLGYAGPDPIVNVSDANVRPSKVIIKVTRYSEAFDNENDDPISPILKDYKDDGYTVDSFTNKKGILFYQVTVEDNSKVLMHYFAQTNYKNDVYMISIEDKLSSTNDDKTIVDTFQWDI